MKQENICIKGSPRQIVTLARRWAEIEHLTRSKSQDEGGSRMVRIYQPEDVPLPSQDILCTAEIFDIDHWSIDTYSSTGNTTRGFLTFRFDILAPLSDLLEMIFAPLRSKSDFIRGIVSMWWDHDALRVQSWAWDGIGENAKNMHWSVNFLPGRCGETGDLFKNGGKA